MRTLIIPDIHLGKDTRHHDCRAEKHRRPPDSAFISLICPAISTLRVDGWPLVSDSRTAFDSNTQNAHQLKASGRLRSAVTAQLSGSPSNNPDCHRLNARCSSRKKSAIVLPARFPFSVWQLQGICFRARRAGNGESGDGRRGVRGSGSDLVEMQPRPSIGDKHPHRGDCGGLTSASAAAMSSS